MAEQKFSPEDLDQFIDTYYNMKCLWGVKRKEYTYRDLNARNNAYSTIADILDVPVEVVNKKINNLLSTYNKKMKKVIASQTTYCYTFLESFWLHLRVQSVILLIIYLQSPKQFLTVETEICIFVFLMS